MEIKQHGPECFSVESFLTEQESNSIISYLDWVSSNNILDWNQISFYGSLAMGFWDEDPTGGCEMFGLPKNYFHGILKPRIKQMGESLIQKGLDEVSYHAQKWVPGAFAAFHSDNSNEDGSPSEFERSKYASFIYLNNDFKGGYLNFKNDDIQIHPKKGMLVFFAGGHNNEHEVTKVHDGTRYTVGSFWDLDGLTYTEEQVLEREEKLKVTRSKQEEVYKNWKDMTSMGIIPDYVGKNGEA
jgi:hypothetical protein